MSSVEPFIHDPLLQAAPAAVDEAQVAHWLAQHFGLRGRLQRLGGERDLNFRVIPDDGGAQRLFKVSHPLEDPQVIDFHNQAMRHVEARDPALAVQRVYPALDGRYSVPVEQGGQTLLVRLLSFVEGQSLHRIERRSPALQRNLGAALARLDRALADFSHPADGHLLLWDMQHALRLRPLLECIDEPQARALAAASLDAFEAQVLPRLAELPRQVIHNDMNPHNLVMATDDPEQLACILDFGDMVRAPRVNELALAAAYQLGTGDDLLAPALEFIRAYHALNPLQAVELELLGELIATRLVLVLAINAWRARLYPDNRDYILRNTRHARAGLQGLGSLGAATVRRRIAEACALESH